MTTSPTSPADQALADAWEDAVATGDQCNIFAAFGYMLASIDADLAETGMLHEVDPATITRFADLHDHVDANEYALAAEAALDLPRPADDPYAIVNAATALVDAVLAQRAARR